MPVFANPAGLWALTAIPVVLLIHFLQRRAKVIPSSTLFLLEKTWRESATGRRFDRLLQSVPLWMQLLAVLLVAWLLSEPRIRKAQRTQRIAIVLDSSASMTVCKDTLIRKLAESLPKLQGFATISEYTLLESTPGKPKLYSGTSVRELTRSLVSWQPREGITDPSYALRLARSLVSREGIVVYATDTPPAQPPFDTRVISTGQPISNVGFTGISFATEEGALLWRAAICNHSDQSADREWRLQFPGQPNTETHQVHLAPHAIVTIQGSMPPGQAKARLLLSPDRFTLDDELPLINPQPKTLVFFPSSSPALAELSEKLTRALAPLEVTHDTSSADLSLVSYDPLDPILPAGNAVVFVNDSTKPGAYLRGGIVAERHPFMDGLNWQTLLVRESLQIETKPSDTVLLWQDTRPLIFLRSQPAIANTKASRQLCINFDPHLSNAATQPAFVLLLHRFAESIRESKVAPVADNLETGQTIRPAIPDAPESQPVSITTLDLDGKTVGKSNVIPGQPIRLPGDPGFIHISRGDKVILDAAIHFGDTREADFSACAPADTLSSTTGSAIERQTDEDPWWRYSVLALLAVLLASWHFVRPSGKPTIQVNP